MHDSEPDTIVLKSYPEKFCDILSEIGVEALPKEIATDKVEEGVKDPYKTSSLPIFYSGVI